MARIFDNIEQDLLGALRATMAVSTRADFCVGYLNLRGWQAVDDLVQPWSAADGQVCRVLVAMQRPPQDEIRDLYRAGSGPEGLDQGAAVRLEARFAAHLREQITPGIPTGKDEVAQALQFTAVHNQSIGGGLGRPSSPRRRTYERLKRYAMEQMNTLFRDEELERALDDIYLRPLLDTSADLLNRLMRGGLNDEELTQAVKSLREAGRLTYAEDAAALREPRVVCSMGLIAD